MASHKTNVKYNQRRVVYATRRVQVSKRNSSAKSRAVAKGRDNSSSRDTRYRSQRSAQAKPKAAVSARKPINHKKYYAFAQFCVMLVIFVSATCGCLAMMHYLKEKDDTKASQNISAQAAENERNQELGITKDKVSDKDKDQYKVDAPDKPRLLTIAKAGVTRARVQQIGLLSPSADGSQQMDAPKNINDAGWYNCQINPVASKRCAGYSSPAINNTQTAAVIDGHSCGGGKCVFDNIDKLASGDAIEIEMGSGEKVTYLVKKVEVVKLADLDMTKVMTSFQLGQPGLNLITCDGSWSSRDSRGVRTMDKRVVVYSIRQ